MLKLTDKSGVTARRDGPTIPLSKSMQVTLEYKTAVSVKVEMFKLNFPDLRLPTENAESLIDELISRSICELKHMVDFLAKSFTTSLSAPKRNSKVSLSRWVAKVLSEAVEIEPVAEEIPLESVQPEIVEPEIYDICLLSDKSDSKYRTTQIPPCLIDGGSLYHKSLLSSHPGRIIYYQVPSEHLSNIQCVGCDTTEIELLCEALSVSRHTICGIPPRYLITKEGGVYERMQRELISRNSVVRYFQVLSEYLSNIAVV
ncbi:MAG: hypothetical protein JGK29_03960 [Microcoleus sp. PH2017_17_BER_D_A]|nr:hypothetical protein [Microcoleus sp. PH2017_17_BER_D_A]